MHIENTLRKLGIDNNFFNLIRKILKIPTDNIISIDEYFLLKSFNKSKKDFFPPISLNVTLETLRNSN